MKLLVLLVFFFAIDSHAVRIIGKYATGFTGRATNCTVADMVAKAEKDRYCKNVSANYSCGPFIQTQKVSKRGRCAIRGKARLTKKRK